MHELIHFVTTSAYWAAARSIWGLLTMWLLNEAAFRVKWSRGNRWIFGAPFLQ